MRVDRVVEISEAGDLYISGVTVVAEGIQQFLLLLGIACQVIGAGLLPYLKIQRGYPSTAPFLFFSWPILLKHLKGADVVHVHSLTPLSVFTIWLLNLSTKRSKIVLTLHTQTTAYVKSWDKSNFAQFKISFLNYLTKYCCLHVDKVLVPSEHFRLQLMKEISFPAVFVATVWSSPIVRPELPKVTREDLLSGGSVRLDSNAKVLIYYGRVGPEKGIKPLIEVIKALDPTLNIALAVVGGGEIEKYQALIPNNLKDRVSFFGQKPRGYAMALAEHAFLAITCSETETQGLTSLELMLMGLLLLALRGTCFDQVINQSGGGMSLGKSPKEWAETIKLLAEFPSTVIEMGAKAREYVYANYSPKARYFELLKIYRNL